jgi:ABC-type uncharacterized transport system involved in gliding motility auxiliary subunit
MKPQIRKYASIGLYLSLLAVITAAGLYIVYRTFNLAIQISLAVAVLGVAFWVLIDPDHVMELIKGRQVKYGSNSLIMTIAFIGIIVVINVIGYKYAPQWDLTEGKKNTLAPETVAMLEKLPSKVTVQAFFTSTSSSDSARTILDSFKRASNGKFDFEFINPNSNPVAAQNAHVEKDETLVLTMGDQQEQVSVISEKEIDTALLKLINPSSPVVYFLSGHGEFDVENSGDDGYSKLKSKLEEKNYTVSTLNLVTSPSIPEDAKVIVIASPMKPLSTDEVSLLSDYLDAGGSVIVMYDPTIQNQFGDAADPFADYLSSNWGITFNNDLIIHLEKEASVLTYAGAYDSSHPITTKMNNLVTVYPYSRSISFSSQLQDVTQTTLVITPEDYWGETDLASLQSQSGSVSYDEATDITGPLPLVVAAENSTNSSRIVAFGDSEFASNSNIDYYGNLDFIVNSVDWASEQEDLITLTPKDTTQRVLEPPQSLVMNLILLASIFVIPGLILVAGVVTAIIRKKRG